MAHNGAAYTEPLVARRCRDGVDVRRPQERPLIVLQPACSDDGVTDELVVEVREEVQCVRGQVREEVLEVWLLVCLATHSDDLLAFSVIDLACPTRRHDKRVCVVAHRSSVAGSDDATPTFARGAATNLLRRSLGEKEADAQELREGRARARAAARSMSRRALQAERAADPSANGPTPDLPDEHHKHPVEPSPHQRESKRQHELTLATPTWYALNRARVSFAAADNLEGPITATAGSRARFGQASSPTR